MLTDKLARVHIAHLPTPLEPLPRLTAQLGGPELWIKRDDQTGLATGGNKTRKLEFLVADAQAAEADTLITAGAAQSNHARQTAAAAAKFGLERVLVLRGEEPPQMQGNLLLDRLLGAEVRPVESGSRTLKDAINEAIRDWVTNVQHTHYLLGSALGPHPYPTIVREFQAVIGREARAQVLEQVGRLPDICVACVGGGSNAIGLFHAFRDDPDVELVGVEAGGEGIESGHHAARFADPRLGRPGVLHGAYTFVLQDADGQILNTHSISAGLDYAAVGPEHAHLRDLGRATYTWADDAQALEAFQLLAHTEGILPALESAHAVAEAMKRAPRMRRDQIMLINLSGRGDKDLDTVVRALGMTEEEVVVR